MFRPRLLSMEKDELLERMCLTELGKNDIKAIGQARGFSSEETASPERLRQALLSGAGVERVLASLTEKERLLLHLLSALGGEVELTFFERIYPSRIEAHSFNERFKGVFQHVRSRLVLQGILLCAVPPHGWLDSRATVLERRRFRFPAEFAGFLPPLVQPVRFEPPIGRASRNDIGRRKLAEMVEGQSDGPSAAAVQAGPFSLEDGRLLLRSAGSAVVEDVHTIVRLTRNKVAAFAAENHEANPANPADVLQALTARHLPPNVEKELREWMGRSERFTLYQGFGLLETAEEETIQALGISDLIAEHVSPGRRLVRTPEKLFERLEQAEQVPIRLSHGDARLSAAPPAAISAFRTALRPVSSAAEKKPATLKRRVRIILEFPNKHLMLAFSKALTEAGCAFIGDEQALTVSFGPGNEEIVRTTLRAFQRKHKVEVQDIK